MNTLGKKARVASAQLAKAGPEARTAALKAMAKRIRESAHTILEANALDMEAGRDKNLTPALLDRLELSAERLEGIASGLESVAQLNDPVGDVLASWDRPNGLNISRVRGPIGVIGIIYESRPNVTADAGALCVRAANAAILRGGSESKHSSGAIAIALRQGLNDVGLPEDAIQIVPTTDRAAVGHLLGGLSGQLDLVVPRGGKSLVARVQSEARVPVLSHLEGLNHTFVHAEADIEKAISVVTNAKMRRPGICGATETLLVDASIASEALPKIAASLSENGCTLKGDAQAQSLFDMEAASDDDWKTEYLAPVISIKIVSGLTEAIAHIAQFGTGHTEAIITESAEAAETFLNEVDSSIVMHNASTQFADGGEFGMGAEIGIATGRLHARGPVGAEQLTTFKYVVRGNGQTRP
jgi:glutamate-5-semialdehyde dehydrogenase